MKQRGAYLFRVFALASAAIAQAPHHSPAVEAGSLEQAILETRADIQQATLALTELQAAHADERRPLAGQMEALREDVKTLRVRAERTRKLRQQGRDEQQALVDQTQALEEQCRFVHSLLAEYRRSLETRAEIAEADSLREQLDSADRQLADGATSAKQTRAAATLLRLAADWNKQKLGGMTLPGSAIDSLGIEHPGIFAILGPCIYFSASDGHASGIAITRLGSIRASIYNDLPEESLRLISLLVAGNETSAPVDVTGGDALRVAQARPTFREHVEKGGFVMVPLVAVGLLAAVLSFWKLIALSRVRVKSPGKITTVLTALQQGNVQAARAAADALREPLTSILHEGIEHRQASMEHIEEILEDRVLARVPRFERGLGLLAVLGGVAPLLGLLGTVTGMIHTFQLVTVFGTGDAKLLSGGISEALVTTEFGLAIAIPVLLVHALLARRVRGIVCTLEETVAHFVHELKFGSRNS